MKRELSITLVSEDDSDYFDVYTTPPFEDIEKASKTNKAAKIIELIIKKIILPGAKQSD
jgi:hypothetical protein